MPTARSHTRIRHRGHYREGDRWLDRRSQGAGRDRHTRHLLRHLDRPDPIERINLGHLARVATELLHAFVSGLPDPTPDPPPTLAVRTFLLDGTAHVLAAPPGGRLADAAEACLGCGAPVESLGRCARCSPDAFHRARCHPEVLCADLPQTGEVVTLTRKPTEKVTWTDR